MIRVCFMIERLHLDLWVQLNKKGGICFLFFVISKKVTILAQNNKNKMDNLDYKDFSDICDALISALHGKYDGSRKNIIVPECPYCGKTGYKFGIYVGMPDGKRKPFMSNCFSCGWKNKDLMPLLIKIGRTDIMPADTTSLKEKIPTIDDAFKITLHEDEDEDDTFRCDLPKGYSRVYFNTYLKNRGYTSYDYDFFEAGVVSRANPLFADYIVFPIYESRCVVGYVARHTWSKKDIDAYNETNKYRPIMRYRNSNSEVGNDFQKLVYNIDAVMEGVCRTVILVEGVFDAVALTRKLNLYGRDDIAVCATFGKQITESKMAKLQMRGVEKVILGYDGDAVKYVLEACNTLDEYFDVLVADIDDPTKDWDDLDRDEIIYIFANKLLTPVEYNLKKISI